MKFNNNFIAGTLQEAAEYTATKISQNFALTQLVENGVVTLEETQNMYDLSLKLLSEGSEDLIPENLELDATDETDPTAGQDAAVDLDVAASGGELEDDLNLEDLEGIVLPDSEGNQYIIQGGVLVPYEDEAGDDAAMGGGDETGIAPADQGDEVTEGTTITEGSDLSKEGGDANSDVAPIEENSVFASNSSIVANLLKNTKLI